MGGEPVRLLLQDRFVGRERLLRHAAVEQHRAGEFARRRQRTGVTGSFSVLSSASLGGVIAFERIIAVLGLAWSTQALATWRWISTISDQVGVLGVAQLAAQLGELGNVALAASGFPDRDARARRAKWVIASA